MAIGFRASGSVGWKAFVIGAIALLLMVPLMMLRGLVTELTDTHEAARADPWRVTDAPPDYIDAMLHAIVGFEIPLTTLTGKWKMSQNRSAADRDSIAAGLAAESGLRTR